MARGPGNLQRREVCAGTRLLLRLLEVLSPARPRWQVSGVTAGTRPEGGRHSWGSQDGCGAPLTSASAWLGRQGLAVNPIHPAPGPAKGSHRAAATLDPCCPRPGQDGGSPLPLPSPQTGAAPVACPSRSAEGSRRESTPSGFPAPRGRQSLWAERVAGRRSHGDAGIPAKRHRPTCLQPAWRRGPRPDDPTEPPALGRAAGRGAGAGAPTCVS